MGTEIQTVKSQMTLKNWAQEIAECQSSDMRKGIDGLATIVQGKLSPDTFSRSLYLFCGRNRNKIGKCNTVLDKLKVKALGTKSKK